MEKLVIELVLADHKILIAIIRSALAEVVDLHAFRKEATESLLGNDVMLLNIAVMGPWVLRTVKPDVSIWAYRATALPCV